MNFKKTLSILAIAGASISFSYAADKNDVSYSVGYSMGKNLLTQLDKSNIAIDKDQLAGGLKDGIDGKDSKLSQKEMQEAMMSFQKKAMEQMKKEQAAKKEK